MICLCGNRSFEHAWTYEEPPEGETRFTLPPGSEYRREVHRCRACGHYLLRHRLDLSGLYAGDYVSATYGNGGLRAAFERIVSLPPERSDNAGRVARVRAFAESCLDGQTLLDVGSGLGVFPHGMRQAGWDCTALDPDPRAAEHAREVVGVRAVCAEFPGAGGLGRYDLVTVNKVLEHVVDPVAMVAATAAHLREGGLVYLEVPDGEAAAAEGPGREEFFVEHVHAFSPASLALCVARAGYGLLRLERLREPSGKYTHFAFART